jgi:hypothetical protein
MTIRSCNTKERQHNDHTILFLMVFIGSKFDKKQVLDLFLVDISFYMNKYCNFEKLTCLLHDIIAHSSFMTYHRVCN